MYDLMGAIVSVWLVTVTVDFVEIDQNYSTYNQTLTFRSEQHCETVLDRGRKYFEESFIDYWGSDNSKLSEYTIEKYSLDCIEWYLATDGEWYMVGEEPTITI